MLTQGGLSWASQVSLTQQKSRPGKPLARCLQPKRIESATCGALQPRDGKGRVEARAGQGQRGLSGSSWMVTVAQSCCVTL